MAQGVYAIEDILPILAAVLGGAQQPGAASTAAGGAAARKRGLPTGVTPFGGEFTSSKKTRKGQLTAGIVSLIGNGLLLNRALGDPLELPPWLGGLSQGERLAPAMQAPQQQISTRNPGLSRSPSAGPVNRPPPAAPQQQSSGGPLGMLGGGGGGGMGGLDIGKLLTSVVGMGGGGGGGGGLGGLLGLFA